MRRKALGKGLSALLPDTEPDASLREALEAPTDSLDPNPFQPRAAIAPERIGELAASIRESGMVQPILVRRVGGRSRLRPINGVSRQIPAGNKSGAPQLTLFILTRRGRNGLFTLAWPARPALDSWSAPV